MKLKPHSCEDHTRTSKVKYQLAYVYEGQMIPLLLMNQCKRRPSKPPQRQRPGAAGEFQEEAGREGAEVVEEVGSLVVGDKLIGELYDT